MESAKLQKLPELNPPPALLWPRAHYPQKTGIFPQHHTLQRDLSRDEIHTLDITPFIILSGIIIPSVLSHKRVFAEAIQVLRLINL